jgi:hypothetical protein
LTRLYDRSVRNGEDDFLWFNNFCKCFLKNEAYPGFKYPRGIYARRDEFKIRVGPIFKLIEEKLFKLRCFAKKVPVNELPLLIRTLFGEIPGFTDRADELLLRFLATDFSAFEASFTAEFMECCEFQLYSHMVQNLPEGEQFMRIIRAVLAGENYCKFGKYVRVLLNARRMSGEMNTSLGNGFSNLMMFLFTCEEFDLKSPECLIEGDDCVASYVGVMVPAAFYERLGFSIKMQYLESPNLASFCGRIFDFETLTVIADPIKAILNLSWCHILYSHSKVSKLRGLLRNCAQSYLYLYPGCPILQSVSLCYMRLTIMFSSVVPIGLDRYKCRIALKARNEDRRKKLPTRPVSMSSRLLMQSVFGILVQEQYDLEKYFDDMKAIKPIEHPVIYDHCLPEWFWFNDRYVTDRFGPQILQNNVRGAHNKDLLRLFDVIKTQNEEKWWAK